MAKNTEETLRRKDVASATAVNDVKADFEKNLRNQSRSDRVEVERAKQALYDRTGRKSAAVEDAAKTDRDRAIQLATASEARAEKASSDADKYREQQAAAQSERHEQEMNDLADKYRKMIAEARGDDGDDSDSRREYREKLTNDAQRAIAEAREEVATERRQAKKLAEQTQKLMRDRDSKSDHLLHTRLHEKDLTNKSKLDANANANRTSRALELEPLREQVMETSTYRRDAQKKANEARSETIHELESDWNTRYTNQTLSHDLEKQKLKTDNEDADRKFGQKLGNAMKEKDSRAAALMARQNADHHENLTTTTQSYERALAHSKMEAARDMAATERLRERDREVATGTRDRALTAQAATYQEAMNNQRKDQQSQIQNLERVISGKNSTDDVGEISAAAEHSVRKAVTEQYDKVYQAEARRNAESRDHLEDTFNSRLTEARDDKAKNAAELNRRNVREQSLMRDTFVHHVADVEENKRIQIDHANASNTKMSEDSLRTQERAQDGLRRHYEEIIATRDEANFVRLQETRNEAEFAQSSMRREHKAQTADLIRGYEKRLSDQKTERDDQVREMKAQLDSSGRQNDKRIATALAEQARNNDHKIAELQSQMKDRERTLARNFEDELDKVKKANALLLSKKG
jgi:hypothetical protein